MLFLSFSADEGGRWSNTLHNEDVDITDASIQKGLPEKNGIIYSNSMGVFYQTFFKHPEAKWKYILGFESALMPTEDLKIFRKIQWNSGAVQTFTPWVEKMRPQDRLWIQSRLGAPNPNIKGLIWTKMSSYIWSGRVKPTQTPPKKK